jgi:hypothetical protein
MERNTGMEDERLFGKGAKDWSPACWLGFGAGIASAESYYLV